MPPNFRKPPVRNTPAFHPRPLLRAGNQPRQGESIPPDKLFRPAESALVFLIIWILLEIVSNFVQQTPPQPSCGGRTSALPCNLLFSATCPPSAERRKRDGQVLGFLGAQGGRRLFRVEIAAGGNIQSDSTYGT